MFTDSTFSISPSMGRADDWISIPPTSGINRNQIRTPPEAVRRMRVAKKRFESLPLLCSTGTRAELRAAGETPPRRRGAIGTAAARKNRFGLGGFGRRGSRREAEERSPCAWVGSGVKPEATRGDAPSSQPLFSGRVLVAQGPDKVPRLTGSTTSDQIMDKVINSGGSGRNYTRNSGSCPLPLPL
jgi:hypothetical protein